MIYCHKQIGEEFTKGNWYKIDIKTNKVISNSGRLYAIISKCGRVVSRWNCGLIIEKDYINNNIDKILYYHEGAL